MRFKDGDRRGRGNWRGNDIVGTGAGVGATTTLSGTGAVTRRGRVLTFPKARVLLVGILCNRRLVCIWTRQKAREFNSLGCS